MSLSTVGFAGFLVAVVAAIVMLNRSSISDARRSDQPPQPQERVHELAVNPLPIETAPSPRAPKRSPAVNRARRPSEPVKAAAVMSPSKSGEVPDDYVQPATLVASDVTRVAQAIESLQAAESAPPPVTITGCLEMSTTGDEFRLTDTEGTDAPKSRGWRTAFLKKRAAPVTLVNPADGPVLKADVGKRMAATGLLASRKLTVSTLHVVNASCD